MTLPPLDTRRSLWGWYSDQPSVPQCKKYLQEIESLCSDAKEIQPTEKGIWIKVKRLGWREYDWPRSSLEYRCHRCAKPLVLRYEGRFRTSFKINADGELRAWSERREPVESVEYCRSCCNKFLPIVRQMEEAEETRRFINQVKRKGLKNDHQENRR